jgi:hypothetical protein
MSTPDRALAVLHALRLRGFADTPGVAALVDAPAGAVADELAALATCDLVRHRQGARTGWVLTPAGEAEHERLVAAELARSGQRIPLEHLYEAFGPLNRRLLQLCTRWQVRTIDGTPTVNDHLDPAYDRAVINDLVAIDTEVQPLVAKMAALLDRFEVHGTRLANALAAVLAGDYDWLASPVIDSYHTVWFELHEDLLVTLGLDRATETAAEAAAD